MFDDEMANGYDQGLVSVGHTTAWGPVASAEQGEQTMSERMNMLVAATAALSVMFLAVAFAAGEPGYT